MISYYVVTTELIKIEVKLHTNVEAISDSLVKSQIQSIISECGLEKINKIVETTFANELINKMQLT